MKLGRTLVVGLCVCMLAPAVWAEAPEWQPTPPEGWSPEPVKMKTFSAGKGLRVDFAILPGQWPGADLWSAWGDAVYASDGNFYCSLGDHSGKAGNSFVYKVDPETGTAEMVVDFSAELGGAELGTYTPGKIHGPLVEHEGWLYFAGYRGASKYTTDKEGYDGDPLMRYNLETGEVQHLGIPVPEVSHPTYNIYERDGKAYFCGLAQPGGDIGGNKHPMNFFVYNLTDRKLVYNGGPATNVARAFIMAPDGRCWWGVTHNGKNVMAMYDPTTNKAEVINAKVPASGKIRACTRVDSNGIAYCLTYDEAMLFAFDTTTNKLKVLGQMVTWPVTEKMRGSKYAYTADIQLSSDGRYLYSVPRSHGGAQAVGAPIVQFDLKTNKARAAAELFDPLTKNVEYVPMGSFGAALSDDGKQTLVVWNGCMVDWNKEGGRKYSAADSRKDYMFDIVGVSLVHLP